MRKVLIVLAAFATACGSRPCFADDDPFQKCLKAGVEELVGGSQHGTAPDFRIEVDGGWKQVRGYGSVGLLGLPGSTTVDPIDITTIKAFRGYVGGYRKFNSGKADQLILALGAQYGFATATDVNGQLLNRNPRTWGVGLVIRKIGSEGYSRFFYGHDETASPDFGLGQLIFQTEIPFTTSKAVWFGVEGVLNVGHPVVTVPQVDRVQVSVGASIPEGVKVLNPEPAPAAPGGKTSAAYGWTPRPAPPSNGPAR